MKTVHASAMVCWCLGLLGLAWHITMTLEDPVPLLVTVRHTTQAALQVLESEYAYRAKELAQKSFFDAPHAWISWYYSPLNIRYWALALFYLSPAFALTLLVHHLAWRQQHTPPPA